jgi:hypothetical protein
VDIVLLVDGIRTLANVVITNPIQTNLISQAIHSCGMVTTMTTQVKERFYHNRYPTNVFLPLVINAFKYFHQQSNNFLDQYINIVWIITKALKALIYWCYICFIVKKCQWFNKEHKPLPSQDRLLLQGKVLLSLEVY